MPSIWWVSAKSTPPSAPVAGAGVHRHALLDEAHSAGAAGLRRRHFALHRGKRPFRGEERLACRVKAPRELKTVKVERGVGVSVRRREIELHVGKGVAFDRPGPVGLGSEAIAEGRDLDRSGRSFGGLDRFGEVPSHDIGSAFRPGRHDAEVDGGAAEIGGVGVFDLARAFGRRVERRRAGRGEPCKHCKERTHLQAPSRDRQFRRRASSSRARAAIKAPFDIMV